MKRCNYCGKEYPDDAIECAVDGQALDRIGPPPLPSSAPALSPSPSPAPAPLAAPTVDPREFEAARRAKANRDMLVGGLWCVGGIIVTVVTLAAASGGGTYVVAWGAIIFGGIQFFRGLLAR
jgi:hypothetical protein